MFSRSIHAVAKGNIFFSSGSSSLPLCKCPTIVSSTHLLMDRHSGYFHILAIVNNTAINKGVLMLFQISFGFLWIHYQKWDSWVKRQSIFNLLRCLHTAFHSGCVMGCRLGGLRSPQRGTWGVQEYRISPIGLTGGGETWSSATESCFACQ